VISAEVSCGHEVEIIYMLPEKLENIGVNGNSITVSGKEAGVATIAVRTSDGFMSDDVCNVIIHSDAQLVLPKALTTIKEQAFADMPVEEVVLGDGVAVIGERAFENCKDLVLINLADNVQIGEYAFDGCDNLTIICTEGSTGHAYAVANGIPYIIR